MPSICVLDNLAAEGIALLKADPRICLLYTSDAADE